MTYTLLTPPVALPVTTKEVNDHLKVGDEPPDQVHIKALTRTAVSYLDGRDGYLGRAVMSQTWTKTFHSFEDPLTLLPHLTLRLLPVTSIVSIKYMDPAGTVQTLPAADYTLTNIGGWPTVVPGYGKSWPMTRDHVDVVTVTFSAGSAEAPPAAIKQAVLLLVGHWYKNPVAVSDGGSVPVEMPFGVKALLAPYRVRGFV